MGKLGWNSGYIGSDQRDTAAGAVGYSKYYLERLDGRFLPLLGIDPDAQAFFDRVIAAGGSLTTTEQIAINQLVFDMKSYGIWTKMKAIYPMVGASSAACSQNLKSSSFTGTFTSGWTFASTGVTPNGTSAYFDTTLIPNTSLSISSAHFSKYNRNNDLSGNKIDGCFDVSRFFQQNYSAGNGVIGEIGGVISYTQSDTRGLFTTIRTSTNVSKVFKNSTQQGTTNTTTITSIPTNKIFIGVRNDGGSQSFFNSYECAFASIGDGLTDTEASNLYTAVQAFQTTLSRQV